MKQKTEHDVKKRAKWVKDEIMDLGIVAIKIGQFISSRKDIVDKSIIMELQELQNDIKISIPIDIDKLFIDNMGKKPLELFEKFDYEPFASASISQIHSAIYKGKEVVVKIKKPLTKEAIELDFTVLRNFLNIIQVISKNRQLQDIQYLLTECQECIEQETDFQNEIQNIKLFKKVSKQYSSIQIPEVYEDLSCQDFIVMEDLSGTKINKKSDLIEQGYNVEKISNKLITFFVDVLLKHGVFHADCHPGNISVRGNKIVFYDFGLVQQIDKSVQENFNKILFYVYSNDIDNIINSLIQLRIVKFKNTSSKKYQIEQMRKLIQYFINYLNTLDINDFSTSVINNVSDQQLPFSFETKYIYLFKTISQIEGIVKYLDPDFNYSKVIDRFVNNTEINIQELLSMKVQQDLQSLFGQQGSGGGIYQTNPNVLQSLEQEQFLEELYGDDEQKTTIQRLIQFIISISPVLFGLLGIENIYIKVGFLYTFFYLITNKTNKKD